MADNKQILSMLLVAFVFIIIALVLIRTISTEIKNVTETVTETNESLDITAARSDHNSMNESYNLSFTHYPIVSINSVHIDDGTVLVEDTDWQQVTDAGNGSIMGINMLNTTTTQTEMHNTNFTGVNYTREPTDYVSDSASRVLLDIIIVFFAIAIFLGVLKYLGIWDISKAIGV